MSFEYLAVDETIGVVLDDETVQHGTAHAHAHQSTITCENSAEFVLGDQVPPGVVLSAGRPADRGRVFLAFWGTGMDTR